MTAVGELLRGVFNDSTDWTAGYKPVVSYSFDGSEFKSANWGSNNSKLIISSARPPEVQGKKNEYTEGVRSRRSEHIFILMRNDGDDDKLDTQYENMITILRTDTCTGYDDNYITDAEEHLISGNGRVDFVGMKGTIVVEDWVA